MKSIYALVISSVLLLVTIRTSMLNADVPVCSIVNPSTAHCASGAQNTNCAEGSDEEGDCIVRVYRVVQLWPNGSIPYWTGVTSTVSKPCSFEKNCEWVPGGTPKCQVGDIPAADPGLTNQGYTYELKTVEEWNWCYDWAHMPIPW